MNTPRQNIELCCEPDGEVGGAQDQTDTPADRDNLQGRGAAEGGPVTLHGKHIYCLIGLILSVTLSLCQSTSFSSGGGLSLNLAVIASASYSLLT